MLAITIRDKDGGERLLSFDQDEVTVGRIEGNDIVLVRGNISKRHASLIHTDGKVLVRDLRSTNGTYVNQRRITAAQELTDDDKVYIGDFVIQCSWKLEGTAPSPQVGEIPGPPPMPGPTENVGSAPAIEANAPTPPEFDTADEFLMEDEAPAPPDAPETPAPTVSEEEEEEEEEEEATQALSLDEIEALDAAVAAAEAEEKEEEEEEEATFALSLEEIAALDEDGSLNIDPKADTKESDASDHGDEIPAEIEDVSEAAPESEGVEAHAEVETVDVEVVSEPPPAEDAPAPPPPVQEEAPAEDELDPIDLVADELFAEQEDLPAPPPPEPMDERIQESQDKPLVDIGAEYGVLAEAFARGGVHTVYISAVDRVVVERGSTRQLTDLQLGSEEALRGLAELLAANLGVDAADSTASFTGTLDSGVQITVVDRPVATKGPIIIASRPIAGQASPHDLVEAGAVSEASLDALRNAVQARKNILVCGPVGSGRSSITNAIAHFIPGHERIALVERAPELSPPHDNVIRLSRDAVISSGALTELLHAIRADRAIIDDLTGPDIFEYFQAALGGFDGLIGIVHGRSVASLLSRLPLELQLSAGGDLGMNAHHIVATCIDLIVVVSGGDHSISEIIELTGWDGTSFQLDQILG